MRNFRIVFAAIAFALIGSTSFAAGTCFATKYLDGRTKSVKLVGKSNAILVNGQKMVATNELPNFQYTAASLLRNAWQIHPSLKSAYNRELKGRRILSPQRKDMFRYTTPNCPRTLMLEMAFVVAQCGSGLYSGTTMRKNNTTN